jgi:hypothetical protein
MILETVGNEKSRGHTHTHTHIRAHMHTAATLLHTRMHTCPALLDATSTQSFKTSSGGLVPTPPSLKIKHPQLRLLLCTLMCACVCGRPCACDGRQGSFSPIPNATGDRRLRRMGRLGRGRDHQAQPDRPKGVMD